MVTVTTARFSSGESAVVLWLVDLGGLGFVPKLDPGVRGDNCCCPSSSKTQLYLSMLLVQSWPLHCLGHHRPLNFPRIRVTVQSYSASRSGSGTLG